MKALLILLLSLLLLPPAMGAGNGPRITHDALHKTILITDSSRSIHMRISYKGECRIDRLQLSGRELLSGKSGTTSSILLPPTVHVAKSSAPHSVSVSDRQAVITDIKLDGGITETWTFEPLAGAITWRIDRRSPANCPVTAAWSPDWKFARMSTWTAALLGNGGVAWFALFDSAHATYGVHTSEVLLWKKGVRSALRIAATSPTDDAVAVRFTRRRNNELSVAFSLSPQELLPKYDAGTNRRRYLPRREDIWAPYGIPQGTASIEYRIQSVDFKSAYDPGKLPPFNAQEIQVIANTVARLGVIDSRLHGGNSWRTPYGPACLHEQYIAQLGLIMQDTNYFNDYARALDFYRDHAIMPDGRVKSRWAYTCEDAMPGTCDSLGFYEAQWGYLLDSNPDYVTNVSELFDFTGDREWLKGQKVTCERALDYLLARDSNANGLVEMMTDDHRAAKGSDWIDIIWASYENAFINAKLYYALTLWSELEELLGDQSHAEAYRAKASLLKTSFNRSTDEGGFWSPTHQWYVHWRDRDSSIHGDNLVTFVNFMAIAYGICDNQTRAKAILESIEKQTSKENLFFWPICMFSYQPGEGLSWQFPFPTYENGDIFLSLGEVGTRAYKDIDPAIPVKYIKRLIARYEKDGLAFQRYLRKSQKGAGDDILAGNAFPIVGLYRDIYGIQPKFNRLYLEPHITAELSGAALKYRLRGQLYEIRPELSGGAKATTGRFELSDVAPFGVHRAADTLWYFSGQQASASLSTTLLEGSQLTIAVERWKPEEARRMWKERTTSGTTVAHVVSDVAPGVSYRVLLDGQLVAGGKSNASRQCSFTLRLDPGKEHTIDFQCANQLF